LKNKIKYFLSNEVHYNNYTGNATLIPWFLHNKSYFVLQSDAVTDEKENHTSLGGNHVALVFQRDKMKF